MGSNSTLDFATEGFEELEEHGFVSDYVDIDRSTSPPTIRPAFNLQTVLGQGFKPKGTKLRFTNTGGYNEERERAAKVFSLQSAYTVKTCEVGRSSSTYTFEEVAGDWNTVMFGEGTNIVEDVTLRLNHVKRSKVPLASVQVYEELLQKYNHIPEEKLNEHVSTYAGSGMLDEIVCSCGWKSGGYYDGAEYARDDWYRHVEKHLLTEPEWPIEGNSNESK